MFRIFVIVCVSLLTDKVLSSLIIIQSPANLLIKADQKEARLECYHGNNNYPYMLWYQHKSAAGGGRMELIGLLHYEREQLEKNFEAHFNMTGHSKGKAWLVISNIKLSDTAEYFCAASQDQSEAYFGDGTKLTVLEKGRSVTEPKVTVLKPSAKECQDPKDNQRKKTLVCVATGFYPDHVTVSWKINDENVTSGVATDAAALRDGEFYKITSRLRVSAEDWFKPDNKFTCIVNFYNGEKYKVSENSTYGVEAEDGKVMTREKYLRISQNAKLSYGVFIVKSCIYGAFVAFLVWKLQSSAGK